MSVMTLNKRVLHQFLRQVILADSEVLLDSAIAIHVLTNSNGEAETALTLIQVIFGHS